MRPSSRQFMSAVQEGFPLVERPYDAIANCLGCEENTVIDWLRNGLAENRIRRIGAVIQHHVVGYRHNAMVVWDIPDNEVSALGNRISQFPFVRLCYQRKRDPQRWNYNLYCMIFGREREEVLQLIETIVKELGLESYKREVLFSKRQFKQRGGRYAPRE